MRRIGVAQFARLNSSRLPGKLLATIGGSSLLERGLSYLAELSARAGASPIICTSRCEHEIIRAAERHGIHLAWLPEESRHTEESEAMTRGLAEQLEARADWLWHPNILTHPFSSLETGERVMGIVRTTDTELVFTNRKRGLIWRGDEPIIGASEYANTKTNPEYEELSHLGYVMKATSLSEAEEIVAARIKPYCLPLTWRERIDIDTADDLEHARAVAPLWRTTDANCFPPFGLAKD